MRESAWAGRTPSGWWNRAVAVALATPVLFLCACAANPTDPSPPRLTVSHDFRVGPQGWTCDAAGYSTLNPYTDYEIVLDYQPLKGSLASQGSAWLLNGRGSFGLILYCKRHVTGLVSNRTYSVDLTVEIATNTPPGCTGLGAPPGEGVVVLAAPLPAEPIPALVGTDMRVSFVTEAAVLGNIATASPAPCTLTNPWELKTLTKAGVPFVASAAGDAWIVAGITKGFMGPNEVFLTKVRADFQP
jgi:hypothetical protein